MGDRLAVNSALSPASFSGIRGQVFWAFVCFFGLTPRCKKSSVGCLEYLRKKGDPIQVSQVCCAGVVLCVGRICRKAANGLHLCQVVSP